MIYLVVAELLLLLLLVIPPCLSLQLLLVMVELPLRQLLLEPPVGKQNVEDHALVIALKAGLLDFLRKAFDGNRRFHRFRRS